MPAPSRRTIALEFILRKFKFLDDMVHHGDTIVSGNRTHQFDRDELVVDPIIFN